MRCSLTNKLSQRIRRGAFSLIEIMLSVAILGIIVFALYSVFSTVTKAVRATVSQVDTMEGARIAMDIMARDIAGLTTFDPPQLANCAILPQPPNQIPPTIYNVGKTRTAPSYAAATPLVQKGLDGEPIRTNYFQETFLLGRDGKDWLATYYRVAITNRGDSIGYLARFATNTHTFSAPTNLIAPLAFTNLYTHLTSPADELAIVNSNFRKILDGVVHLSFTPYDAAGRVLNYDAKKYYSYTNIGNYTALYLPPSRPIKDHPNVAIYQTGTFGGESWFLSNALPSYIEIEMAVVEPDVLRHYQAMKEGNQQVATDYLAKQAGRVHVFRKRVPITQVAQ